MTPSIGQHLRRLRHEAHLTQLDVARRAKVSERTVINVESQAFPPSLETLQKIARVFGRTVILSSKPRTHHRND